jgi:hypothetical protein
MDVQYLRVRKAYISSLLLPYISEFPVDVVHDGCRKPLGGRSFRTSKATHRQPALHT